MQKWMKLTQHLMGRWLPGPDIKDKHGSDTAKDNSKGWSYLFQKYVSLLKPCLTLLRAWSSSMNNIPELQRMNW